MKVRIKKRHWIPAIVVLAIVVLVARGVPVVDWLERVVKPLREMGAAGVVLYALGYFAAAMLCLPCMPLTLAAGYIFGTVNGVIAVHTACTLAAACGFLLGRMAGRKHVAEWLRKSKRFHFLDDAIKHEGWKIVGLLRMHPVPFGASNYLYGMTAIDFWHYLLATFLAMLPGHLIYVHAASLGGQHLTGQSAIGWQQWIGPVLGVVSTVVLTAVVTRIVRKRGSLQRAG